MDGKNIAPVLISITALGVAIFAITRKAGAAPSNGACKVITPGVYHYFTYVGANQTFREALGECYPVVYTVDLYDEDTDDWWPPADPENNILETNTACRVKVLESCKLCGFVG